MDDPNAYSDLIAKIYDPQAVRAEFDQILQNAQISTATQKDAVTFYSDMTPFDLTWHEVLANRLYMFEPNEVQWAHDELSRMLNPMMDQTRLIRYAELAQATAIKDTQMSCAKSALTAFYRALVERGVLTLSDADIMLTVTTTTAQLQDYVNDYVDVYPILAYRGRSIYQIDDYLAFLNSAAGREFTAARRKSNSTLCARLARQEGLGVATILAKKGA